MSHDQNMAAHKILSISENCQPHLRMLQEGLRVGRFHFANRQGIHSNTANISGNSMTANNTPFLKVPGIGKWTVKLANASVKELADAQKTKEQFVIQKAQQSNSSGAKAVVIIFSFYGASEKALGSYCRLYHGYGFDVVVVPSYLKHFAWPDISRELAMDLLNFIKSRCMNYEHILIHAFSMGAYNFTVCMSEMYSAPEEYLCVQNKISAAVYDSLTIGTLKNMATGVGYGISKNTFVQKIIPLSMSLYFKVTSKVTVEAYEYYIDLFKQKPLQVPTLLFYCKNDPISEYNTVRSLLEDWKKQFSFNILDKSWEQSKHSAHLLKHKEEYTSTVDKFLMLGSHCRSDQLDQARSSDRVLVWVGRHD